MTPQELAQARANAYTLLSSLFLHGVTEENLLTVQSIEELNVVVGTQHAASLHYQLFGLNVFPYESAFLGADGMLGGEVSEAVGRFYAEIRLPLETAVSEPDHIGHQLHALAFLCGAEADAWEDDLPAIAERMQQRQQEFLQRHLLRWIRPFIVAVRQQNEPFYGAVANLLWDVVAQHAEGNWPTFALAAPPDVLADEKAGLREIVGVLIRPLFSGWLLTRRDITLLSRQLNVPHGFGSREQMLLNLLRSAAQYEAMPHLIEMLLQMGERWEGEYKQLALDDTEDVWQMRLAETKGILQQMAESVST